jgi:hypothetical protein
MSKPRIRKPEVDVFTARVPASLLAKVDEICRTQNKSRNQAVIESLAQFVEVQGDYVGMRKHFQMSLEWKLEEKIGRIERLNRQYFTLIINILTILINSIVGKPSPVIKGALEDLKEVDEKLYPPLKARADGLAPAKPRDHVPPKPAMPKE